MVAGGQCSGDRRGDRCGDWHRDRRLVGLVVLTWWPVFGFGGGIWLVGLLWVCWVCSGYLVGFILFFFNFGFLVPVGFCWAEGSGGVVVIVCLVVAGARG